MPDASACEVYDRADLLVPRRCVRAGTLSDPYSCKDNDSAASDACIFTLSLCRDAQGTSLSKVKEVATFEPILTSLTQLSLPLDWHCDDHDFYFCGNELVTGASVCEVYNCVDSLVPGRCRRSGSVLAYFLKLLFLDTSSPSSSDSNSESLLSK